MSRFLPSDPRARAIAVFGGTALLLLLVTQFVFPKGTPMAILYDGLALGLVSSMTTAGIVLIYRTIRIINFAQTAFGVFGGVTFFLFTRLTPMPFLLNLLAAALISIVVGCVAGVISVRFLKASRLVLTVVTAVAALFLVQFSPNIARLSFFSDVQRLPQEDAVGATSLTPYLPFPGWEYQVGDSGLEFGFAHVFAIELSLVVLVMIGLILRYTRIGVAVRAMAENPERAGLLGISVPALVIGVFGVSGLLGGFTTVTTGMLTTPAQGNNLSPAVLLAALCGAVLGRMERLPTAVFATVALSIFTRAFRFSFSEDLGLISVIYVLVLSIGLIVQGRGNARIEQAEVAWAATEESRRIPSVLAALPMVRNARRILLAIVVVAVGVVPFVGSVGFVNLASTVAIGAIVVVSLVVLTGWAGQVSMGQWGFAAVGAVVSAALTATVGLPFWIAVPVAVVVSAGVAVLIGIPAMRIRGLFLLPVTLAFAFAVENVLFDDRYFGWLLPDETIERPTLFFLDFADETSMYFLSVLSLGLAVWVVSNLRRSRTGRLLIALRDNETNVQSFGVDVFRSKLIGFAMSGALAGFAGAVFVHQQQALTADQYGVLASLESFNAAIIGGVASPLGALLGTFYFDALQFFLTQGIFQVFLQNGGTIIMILAFPGGFVSLLQMVRDGGLRVIAQRNRIIVPSLFADFDPDAADRALIPLDDVNSTSGLAALPAHQRWAMSSDLYRGRARSAAERFAMASRSIKETPVPEQVPS